MLINQVQEEKRKTFSKWSIWGYILFSLPLIFKQLP